MPVEEITLSVPQSLAEWSHGDDERTPKSDVNNEKVERVSKLAGAYLNAVRVRDRFAFTHKGRMRNRERFNQSLKAVVRNVATDASSAVKERSARLEIRTQIYGGIMQLVKAMSRDQLDMMMRARRQFRWSLAVGAVGLLGVTTTLVLNDIVIWPL